MRSPDICGSHYVDGASRAEALVGRSAKRWLLVGVERVSNPCSACSARFVDGRRLPTAHDVEGDRLMSIAATACKRRLAA
jgi:hypothetical protein